MRLSLGGTVSGSTLVGAVSVESPQISVVSHGGYLGVPGRTGFAPRLVGRPGSWPGSRPTAERLITLTLAAWDRDATGTVTHPDGRCAQLEDSQDLLLSLLDPGRPTILSREMADGSVRWIEVEAATPAAFQPGPLFGGGAAATTIVVPLTAHYPWWQSLDLRSETVTSDIPAGGTGVVHNAVVVLDGGAAIENPATGDRLENLDSGAITVDVGAMTVTQGGLPADNLLAVATPQWLRFGPGSTSVTVSGTVDVEWRDHWI